MIRYMLASALLRPCLGILEVLLDGFWQSAKQGDLSAIANIEGFIGLDLYEREFELGVIG